MRTLALALAACALSLPAAAVAQDAESPLRTAEPEPELHAGLMITGGAITVGTYAFTALVGLELLTYDSPSGTYCTNCTTEGLRLLIPLVGPFAAIPVADGTDGKIVCAVMGLVQVTGLTLGIAGTSRFASDLKAKRAWRAEHGAQGSWSLSPIMASADRDQPAVPGMAFSATF